VSRTATRSPVDKPAPAPGDVAVARPVVEFMRAVNAGDLDAAVAQLAPNAVHHARVSDYTPEGVRMLFGMLRRVFPDLYLDICEQDVQGNRVISRITASGTHRGSYLGRPATGERVVWKSVDIADVGASADGRGDDTGESDHRRVLTRYWDLWNAPELYKPIGFIPAA
jgi:predicted ester cyclase